jgi:hypothetical protein
MDSNYNFYDFLGAGAGQFYDNGFFGLPFEEVNAPSADIDFDAANLYSPGASEVTGELPVEDSIRLVFFSLTAGRQRYFA